MAEQQHIAEPSIWQRLRVSSVVRGLILGQCLSFVMALMAVLSKLLVEEYSFSTPALQNALGYFATFAFTLVPYASTDHDSSSDNYGRRLIALFIIAVTDSQASFFGNLAFRYRVTVSSAGMLSSFTIPCVMVLSFIFLATRYKRRQLFGVIIALLGITAVFLADSASQPMAATPNAASTRSAIVGDLLILLSSAVYAVANVITEGYVKTQDLYEFLLWLGIFGFIISAVQFALLEIPLKRAMIHEVSKVEATFAGYAFLFALFYFFTAKFLAIYDATALNLSLLTTGLWGMLFGKYIFAEQLPVLKFVGYGFVVLGISLYHSMLSAMERKLSSPILRPSATNQSQQAKSYGAL